VTDSATLSAGENVGKIAANVLHTFAPHPVAVSFDFTSRMFNQPSAAGFWRDYFFLIYQTNLLVIGGLISSIAVGFVVFRNWSRANRQRRIFWISFLSVSTLLAIAVVGTPEKFGVSHAVHLPLALLIVTLVAAAMPAMPRWLRVGVVIAWLIDFAIGICLLFYVQSRVFQIAADGPLADPEQALSRIAMSQWYAKEKRGWVFLGDLFQDYATALQMLILVLLAAAVLQVFRLHVLKDKSTQLIADA
jgi:hypothetical protein